MKKERVCDNCKKSTDRVESENTTGYCERDEKECDGIAEYLVA